MAKQDRPAEEPRHGVARVTRAGEHEVQVTMLFDLSPREYDQCSHALQRVREVVDRREVEMMRTTFEVLSSTLSFHSHLLESGGIPAERVTSVAMPSLTAHLFGWLSAGRLFLDHSAALISATFGSDSVEMKRFREATAWAFDHSIGYRFADQLRNAFQHVGVPPFSLTMSGDSTSPEPRLRLTAKREQLLNFYPWKKVVRQDLGSLPDEFDAHALLSAAAVQFEFIAGQVRDLLRKRALPSIAVLEQLLQRVPGGDEGLALCEVFRSPLGDVSFSPQQIDAASIRSVRNMPAIPAVDGRDFACVGDLTADAAETGKTDTCRRGASLLLLAPFHGGTCILSCCDVHSNAVARAVVRKLGASTPIHPSLHEYLTSGLAAAGYPPRHIISARALEGLERTSEPLPDLGWPVWSSGWMLPRDLENARSTARAVGALQVWAQEGGGTHTFMSHIHRMMTDDGSHIPLTIGLINVSASLAKLVARLHGRSVEAVLGAISADLSSLSSPEAPQTDADQDA